MIAQGASFWPLQVRANSMTRSFICASTNLRQRCWMFKSHGESASVFASHDARSWKAHKAHNWLVNEIRQYWKRVLKRIDVTSRTLVTLIEPGSCFARHAGRTRIRRRPLLHADRHRARATTAAPPRDANFTAMNFGPYPMSHGLTRGCNRASRPIRNDVDELRAGLDRRRRSMPRRPRNLAL